MATSDEATGLAGRAYGRRRVDAITLLAGASALLVTALIAATGDVSSVEARVWRWVNHWPGWPERPLVVVMQSGALGAVAVAAVAALLWRQVRLTVELVVAGLAAWEVARLLKTAIGRGRPLAFFSDVVVRGGTVAGEGYPSGHVAVAAALATTATPWLPTWARWAAWTVVAVVAVARLYVGAHLPVDVLGGAALGLVVGSVVHLALGAPVSSRSG